MWSGQISTLKYYCYKHKNIGLILVLVFVTLVYIKKRNEIGTKSHLYATEVSHKGFRIFKEHSGTSGLNTTHLQKPNILEHEDPLRFIVMGDWGGQSEPPFTTPVLLNVADALADFCKRHITRFVLSLGDNFCHCGVKNVDDTRFQDTFENVFTGPALQRPWYVIAGNDDYKGNVSAEIEYTKKSKRWFFEREYYKLSYQLPTFRNITVEIIMLDTVQLCGMIEENGFQPTGPLDNTKAEKQWRWIETQLKLSRAHYLIVAGHYPVLSAGRHGSTICLKNRLKPLLEKYKVSAYFAGHDHSVQHYKGTDTNAIDYFVTGATHPRNDAPTHLDGLTQAAKYFWTANSVDNIGAFTYCDISKDMMSVAFVNSRQQILYFTTIQPRTRKQQRHHLFVKD